jgi:hypothetical protein
MCRLGTKMKINRMITSVAVAVTCAFVLGWFGQRYFHDTQMRAVGADNPRVVALRHQMVRRYGLEQDNTVAVLRNHELVGYFRDANFQVVPFDDKRYRIVRTERAHGAWSSEARDTVADRPILVWKVSRAEIVGDQAIVWVTWFQTGTASVCEEIILTRKDATWIVVSTGQKIVS